MSDILKSNLEFISKHNKTLSGNISQITEYTKNFEIKTNLAGEYNLVINGMAVHSLTGAVEEAKNILSALPHNENGSIHLIYGMGLGYLPDEFINNAKGAVIVYEQDMEILHFVLSAVDFSQNFKTGRLYIASDLNELEEILYNIYKYKSKASLSFVDYYKTQYRHDFETFRVWLVRKIELIDHNYKLQMFKMFTFFESTIKSLDKKYNLPPLTEYKDAFKDKPAIIVSAGPSLNKNIEVLKKYKDNAIVFCVGTALRSLYRNNITPDFLNVIETVNTSLHYNLPISKDINFIAEPYTEKTFLDIEFKNRFVTPSLETDASRWFLEKAEKEFTPFETKGTVAYHALYSAYYLGCNPIILIGQDLAYTDGQCYSKGSKFDGLQCVFDEEAQKYMIAPKNFEEYRDAYFASEGYSEERKNSAIERVLARMNNNIKFVQGQDGEMLPTDSVYAIFIDYFKEFAAVYGHERTLINSSLGGALIKGFETAPLDEVCEKFANKPIDKESLFSLLGTKNSIDNKIVIKNLRKDTLILKEVLPLLKEGCTLSSKLNKILETNPVFSSAVRKYLDNLSRVYITISNKYMLKYRVVKMLVAAFHCELSFLSREKNVIDSLEWAQKYSKTYTNYFSKGLSRIETTISLLEEAVKHMEEADESCFAKG